MSRRLCVFSLAVAAATLWVSTSQAQEDAFRTTLSDAEQKLISLINGQRQDAKAADLKPNRRLMAAARIHAQNMAALDKGAHELEDAKEGWRTPKDRLDYVKWQGFGWGENIAWGSVGLETMVDGWMNSEGHRKNMLNENFQQVGVGVVGGKTGRYICAVFGSGPLRESDIMTAKSKDTVSKKDTGASSRTSRTASETWRYRFHQGRWWYWLPSERWVVWIDGRWVEP